MKNKTCCYFKIFVIYIVIPVVLFFIPVSLLDSLPSVCLFRNLTSVLHLRFDDAFGYNKLIVLVFPLSLFLFIRSLLKNIKNMFI